MKFNYSSQNISNISEYLQSLNFFASISRVFSDSNIPFLHYRVMENVFCKSFNANNLARSDVSVDAKKDLTGIGLKTFLQKNGYTLQKIAEFNRQSYLFKGMTPKEIIKNVSNFRNKRLSFTKNAYNLEYMIYHLITRDTKKMMIFEEDMHFINIDRLNGIVKKNNTINFNDGINEYSFSLSKHTLFKRFDTNLKNALEVLNIEILSDPYDHIKNKIFDYQESIEYSGDIKSDQPLYISEGVFDKNENYYKIKSNELQNYLILPLYSPKSNRVEKKSGLNMWNASGRKRHPDEVYIPVPSWIHKSFPDFFPYKDDDYPKSYSFMVTLPNRKSVMSMKVTQAGGKAIQSDPNKDLGKWILRDILEIENYELVTKQDLDIIGIDSVILIKQTERKFQIDFMKSGSYKEFENKFK